MANLKNINFMSKERFDSLSEISDDELYAVKSQVVVETYQNGTEWYRVYSDGWIEQGGLITNSNANKRTQTLLKEMLNTKYSVMGCFNGDGALANGAIDFYNKTTTSFELLPYSQDNIRWEVKGYMA